jgi:hypothetical protein
VRLIATKLVNASAGTKALRLYVGDLSDIPPQESVDVLVVSAFPNDYVPTRTSLIGHLDRRGISVADLARDKQADLREAFSSWLSRDISASVPDAGFKRILCFESSLRGPPNETVGDVFRAIVPFLWGESPIRSIAMPVLASGNQRFDPEVMFKAICSAALHWLAAGLPLDTVKIVVRDEALAERLAAEFQPPGVAPVVPLETTQPALNPTYDFFVSYSHDDAEHVDALVSALRSESAEVRIFQDKLVLNPGESWQVALDHALEQSQTVIAVYSPSYLRSKMCIEEFNLARMRHRESGGVLKPIYLKTAELPLYMRSVQYIDCREADSLLISHAVKRILTSRPKPAA